MTQRPDFDIQLQRQHGLTLIHCDVYRWDQHVARAIGRCVDMLVELHGTLWAFTVAPHGGDWQKWRNFACHYGFRFFATVTYDGVRHSVYVRQPCRS